MACTTNVIDWLALRLVAGITSALVFVLPTNAGSRAAWWTAAALAAVRRPCWEQFCSAAPSSG
jgi:hypothetical protein